MNLHIRWRIALPFIFLILFIMVTTGVLLAYNFYQLSLEKLESNISTQSYLLANNLSQYNGDFSPANQQFDQFSTRWSEILGARITIISGDGTVLGESQANRNTMDNHLNRPEVQQALSNGFGRSVRYSQTEGLEFMYTAVPVYQEGEIVAFIRIAITTEQVQEDTTKFIRPIVLITILSLLLAILFAAVIAEYLSRPVRQLTTAVKQVTVEDLNLSPLLSSGDELGQLANAFEAVVVELQSQVNAIEKEEQKLKAVLQQLEDGVVIVDQNGTIQMINPAAMRIFNLGAADAVGQSLAVVARHHDVVSLWKNSQRSKPGDITSMEITTNKIVIEASGISLSKSLPGSSLLVFHDVTQLRHLETVRRDFISNISHELRTPLASLKALTETLQDGALEDSQVAGHFLNRINVEVDSLSLIVQELLELSRIESGRVPLKFEPVDPRKLIRSAVERLQLQADTSQLDLKIDCGNQLPSMLADFTRLEQVLVNLLHNAIKFTPPGGSISINCHQDEQHVIFSVADTGIGISSDDFPRIFERFFKADRARASGGTGLGLAISKHLVEAHHGTIWAESEEGSGSTFYFSIPLAT
jgi:two-component system phosphate regulon sensor histidine kinase PhoR